MTTVLQGALATAIIAATAPCALGQEAAQTRIPWSADGAAPGEAVEWVYEGCAAYPVAKDDVAADGPISTPVGDVEDRVALSARRAPQPDAAEIR
jgi:hypothetical protein